LKEAQATEVQRLKDAAVKLAKLQKDRDAAAAAAEALED